MIFLAFVVFVFLFGLLVVPPLVHQVTGLADDMPQVRAGARRRATTGSGSYFREHDVTATVQDFISTLPERIRTSFGTILGRGRAGGQRPLQRRHRRDPDDLFHAVAPVDAQDTRRSCSRSGRREHGARVIDQSIEKIGGYVYGNVITSVDLRARSR